MKKLLLPLVLAAGMVPSVLAQHYDMKQWGTDRGYTDAPYFRYEAEPGHCTGYSGTCLEQTDDQTYLQSEASNQQAITIGNGGYVEWRNDSGEADGVTLRFSVPWNTTATVAVYAGDEKLGEMALDAGHSWQFCKKEQGSRSYKPEFYSQHVYNDRDFARMRFDEKHTLLSRDIRSGEKFSIRNLSDTPVTVDFLEIEKARKVEYQDGWVRWNQSIKNNLQEFINENQGKTIYIDQAYVGIWGKLSPGSCTLQGRGIFYTELHWEQNGAGFNSFGGQVKDMYLSSYQQQRYDADNYSPGTYSSPGKCFNGNVGYVENVLVEHFECGGWLDGADGAHFNHCRFRNNYADGINFRNASNCTFEHSSFRNNGDDDMASWNSYKGNSNNTFRYCTAENNWRASSLAFFGGNNHRAENLLVKDALENGVRLVTDFDGEGYGTPGATFRNISIVHCACIKGDVGRHGDFWGVDEGALHIESSSKYDLTNQNLYDIDIYDSRGNAVFIGSGSKSMNDIEIKGINVHGVRDAGSYAFYFENPKGSASISDITVEGIGADQLTNVNNGKMESYSGNGFTLSTTGVEIGIDEIEGVMLTLNGMAWNKNSRDGSSGLKEGDNVTFSVRVENVSQTTDLPEDYPVRVAFKFADGSTVTTSRYSDGIKAGQGLVLTADWKATAGGHSVTAVLDPSGALGSMVAKDGVAQISKKINVELPSIEDLAYTPADGIDFQVLDLRWRREGVDEVVGKGPINIGDRVIFSAVIVNAGKENSSSTSKLGVVFRMNGQEYAPASTGYLWCDKNESLKTFGAGQIKLFEATGQKDAPENPVWIAETGAKSFLVHVNDSGDRDETDKSNNTATFPLSIPYKGLAMNEFVDEPDSLNYDLTSVLLPVAEADRLFDGNWYTVGGMVLMSEPQVPGVYIHRGEKVVIR